MILSAYFIVQKKSARPYEVLYLLAVANMSEVYLSIYGGINSICGTTETTFHSFDKWQILIKYA